MITSNKQFARIWNAARNAAHAASKLKMSERGAREKAKRLRALGHKLKTAPVGRPRGARKP